MMRIEESLRANTRRKRTVTIDGLDPILQAKDIFEIAHRYGSLLRIYSRPLQRGNSILQSIQITFTSAQSLEALIRDKPFGTEHTHFGPIFYNRVNCFGQVWYDVQSHQLHRKQQQKPSLVWCWPDDEMRSSTLTTTSPTDSLWEHYLETNLS